MYHCPHPCPTFSKIIISSYCTRTYTRTRTHTHIRVGVGESTCNFNLHFNRIFCSFQYEMCLVMLVSF